jgi:hypothetical protein
MLKTVASMKSIMKTLALISLTLKTGSQSDISTVAKMQWLLPKSDGQTLNLMAVCTAALIAIMFNK